MLKDADLFVEHHPLNVVRVAQHQEQMISLLSDLLRSLELGTSFDEVVSLRCCPIEDEELVALSLKVTCHALTHDTRTNPAYSCACLYHLINLSVF